MWGIFDPIIHIAVNVAQPIRDGQQNMTANRVDDGHLRR